MSQTCSACQQTLAPDAPQGLCPECLLKAGLGTGMDIGPDSQSGSAPARFVAPAPDELQKAFPQLEMLGFIGQGGMGAVYKARQKALDRIVALKILPPGIGNDPAFADRFAREAKALARLNHSGIVTLYEFGQADGLYYFLMEFVDGVNLRHLLEAGRLSSREALAIVPQICDALQYAHDQGIVHRDIKPENILLDRLGRVKVADFGLAKLIGSAETPAEEPAASGGAAVGSIVLTDAGKVMGTPQYMAPEQSETPAAVDHRADIYSLGVVLYQMLTGELPGKPLEAPSRRVLMDVRIDEIVLRALDREPERRYQQASAFKTHIETVASGLTDSDATGDTKSTGKPAPAPSRLRSRFVVVGQRAGKPVIYWPGLLINVAIVATVYLAIYNGAMLAVRGHIDNPSVAQALLMAGTYAAFLVYFLKKTPVDRLLDLDAAERAHKSTDWRTWSPFQSPQVIEVCNHMTDAERREVMLRGAFFGIWNAATFFLPVFIATTFPQPLNWAYGSAVLVIGLLFFPLWQRIMREYLASTAWARQQGIAAESLRTRMGIRITGTRVWKILANWQAMLLCVALAVLYLRLTMYQQLASGAKPGMLHNAVSFELIFLVVLIVLFLLPRLVRAVAKRRKESALEQSPGLCEPPHAGAPRMSRVAIAGAMWAMASAVAFVVSSYATARVPGGAAPSTSLPFFKMSLLVLALSAPVGTTMLGSVAISQIRRSSGRLHGMWLAVLDRWLFPLLVLDAAIAWMWGTIIKQYVDFFVSIRNLPPPLWDNWRTLPHALLVQHQTEVVCVLTLTVGGLLDYLIIRDVWRAANAVNGPLDKGLPTTTSDTHLPRRAYGIWMGVAIILVPLALFFLFKSYVLSHTLAPPGFEVPGLASHQPPKPVPNVSTLPQGTIELVAVTSYPEVPGQPWWNQNGSPYTGPSLWLCVSTAPLMEQVGRQMALRLIGMPADTSSPIWRIEQASGTATGGVMLDGRPVQDMCGLAVSLPKSIRTTNVRVGVAMGSWETVATQAPDSPGSSYAGIKSDGWTVSFIKPENTEKGAYVTITHTVKGWDTRVVAVELAGAERTPNETQHGSLLGPFANISAGFSGLPLKEIKEFRFQVRPYHWVEFNNVALYPAERIVPQDGPSAK